jgi:Tol biopolymer transport system component
VEETEAVHFITMGLVRGKSLTELIPRSGLPLGKFFDQAITLANAISAAHQQGITHRDLKPDNIMIGDDGRLKVLDFGLAKLRAEARTLAGSQLTTATATLEGKILGTVSYMSPEQAEGKPVDHRSDVFSLGVTLYQMATGRLPFTGDTNASIISSILKDMPVSITDLNPALPRHLWRIIQQCLQKEPDRRFQTVLDLCNQLAELKKEIESGEVAHIVVGAQVGSRKRTALWISLATAFVVILVVSSYLLVRWWSYTALDSRALNLTFTKLTSQPGQELFPSLSPDGQFFVYASPASGNWDIYLQRVDGAKAINLTESSPDEDTQPAFSPDGKMIAFRSEREGGGIFIMGATGESVKRLADFGFNPAWSPDGQEILVAMESIVSNPESRFAKSAVWAIDSSSAAARRITEGDAVQPVWSPDGGRIAYWTAPGDPRSIMTKPAQGGEPTAAVKDWGLVWNPVWSPDGRYLYFSSDQGGSMKLWRAPIDENSGETLGNPEPITTGGTSSHQHLSFSSDGRRLAYTEMIETCNIHGAAFDGNTAEIDSSSRKITHGTNQTINPWISPDGEWLVFTCFKSKGQEDLCVSRSDGTGFRQLTNDMAIDRQPRWSPDGERIAFHSDRTGRSEIWSIKPDGSGLKQLTDVPEYSLQVPVWSPDASRLLFFSHQQNMTFVMDPTLPWNEQTPEMLPPVSEDGHVVVVYSWSPDGQRLAGNGYHKDGTRAGIFAYSLETEHWEQLLDFGRMPIWLKDSRRLLFWSDGALFLLDTATREHREIISLDPPAHIGWLCTIAPDNQTIYFTRIDREADIWLLDLN